MSNQLNVTKIIAYTSNFDSNTNIGYGMITFNDAITVKFNIMKARTGNIFVAWPKRKKSDDEYVPFITFEDIEIKKTIDNAILEEFNKKLSIKNGGKSSQNKSTVNINTNSNTNSMEKNNPTDDDNPFDDKDDNNDDADQPKKKKGIVVWGKPK